MRLITERVYVNVSKAIVHHHSFLPFSMGAINHQDMGGILISLLTLIIYIYNYIYIYILYILYIIYIIYTYYIYNILYILYTYYLIYILSCTYVYIYNIHIIMYICIYIYIYNIHRSPWIFPCPSTADTVLFRHVHIRSARWRCLPINLGSRCFCRPLCAANGDLIG